MKIHELPTHLVRELVERCVGLNASLGDERVALLAVIAACHEEIEKRMYEAADFPVLGDAEVASLSIRVKTSPPGEFRNLIFELER